jgi:dTDP-4-amino-4,6-dideoxygalactose transaminase
MNKDKKTFVTKTFLPPIEEYTHTIETIWNSNIVSNRGELVMKFENELREITRVNNVLCLANATLGLQFLIKSLGNGGSIITTPYSYVATTSSIVWENFKPKFIDIKKDSFQIDIEALKENISKDVKAILLTHVYGIPENIAEIEAIAKNFQIPLFFDGAQSFGVKYNGNSIFQYGDATICSFHATKIIHCGEGGALFTNNKLLYDKIFKYHNFGHAGYEAIDELGINGKMSELNAAMGLTVLPYLEKLIEARKQCFNLYKSRLNIEIKTLSIPAEVEWNYTYFPIILASEDLVIKLQSQLNKINIFPRRYFYPSLSSLSYLKYEKMINAEDLCKRVLCLPIHHELSEEQIFTIVEVVNQNFE